MNKTVFKDYKGVEWSEENLNELIKSFHKFKEVLDTINYF